MSSICTFSNLLEKLVTSKFDGEKSLDHYLGNILQSTRKTSSFIIITRYMDELIVEKLITMRSRGSNVSIYIISDAGNADVENIDTQSMFLSLEQNRISTYSFEDLDQL